MIRNKYKYIYPTPSAYSQYLFYPKIHPTTLSHMGGETDIWHAAARGDERIVAERIAHGSREEINQPSPFMDDTKNDTPLMLATRSGHPRVVQLLIGENVDLNRQNNFGFTAIMLSVIADQIHILNALIQAGANVNIPDGSGRTPLMIAAGQDRVDMVDAIIAAGADVNRGNNEFTPLILASRLDLVDVIDALIAAGADVNTRTIYNTPLTAAASRGNASIVDRLFIHGADMNAVDISGKNALMLAAEHGHVDLAIQLLEYHIFDANQVDHAGQNALMLAAKNGHTKLVKTLLPYGIFDVNQQDHAGNNALMLALTFDGPITDLVNELINAGIDVSTQNNRGQKAFDIAFDHDHHDLLHLLHGYRPGYTLDPYADAYLHCAYW